MKIEQLISKIKEGDKRAFKYLYEGYAPLFMGIAYRYVGNESESGDILQETFIKIYKNINNYTGKGNFEGWMKRILVNNCLNYIKKEKKYTFETGEALLEKPNSKWDAVIEDLSFEEIVRIIDRLPIGYKTVFNLSVFEGYAHKEIAEMLNISESASRSQLTKAKAKLKEELKKIDILSSIA